jgi:hypothetical protein
MIRRLSTRLRTFASDRRGNVAIIAAAALPVLLGSLGLGAEVGSWYAGKRALQNAADSAVIAAATNAGERYASEARAVAANYGLRDGVDGVTVEAVNNAPCPDGSGNTCYRVTVSRVQPLLLVQAAGYQGDAQMAGHPAKRIAATAVAVQALGPREYCVLALAGSGDPEALRSNGAPNAELTGCNVASNSGMRCNGHDLGANFGDAHGTNSGCGHKRNSNVDLISDQYAARAASIPANPCGGAYHWFPQDKKKDPPLPTANTLQGLEPRSFIPICGDGELHGPTLLTGGDVTIVVYGGSLDLADYMLQTTSGTHVTIIFTGPEMGHGHIPMGSGTLDIEAPKTGVWKGVAIYQDPALTTGVNISAAGNSPTWNITGLAYLPHASVTFSGAVNKSSNGKSCFALVVDNLTINGTANILAQGECAAAGLTMPTGQMPSRGQLVS